MDYPVPNGHGGISRGKAPQG